MRTLLCLAVTVLVPYAALGRPGAALSAWDTLVRDDPALTERASALEREVLQLMTLDQVEDYRRDAAASAIVLATGETLQAFLARKGAAAFDISWYSIDGGGGTMAGGVFALVGTIGQADAGVMSGGTYTLTGGFLGPDMAPPSDPCAGSDAVFCDGFELGDASAWSVVQGAN